MDRGGIHELGTEHEVPFVEKIIGMSDVMELQNSWTPC
jgi:hypothetical protein